MLELQRHRGPRAFALLEAGRDWEAERLLAQLHASGERDAALVRRLGWARLALGDVAGAETCMREALASAPDEWESHYALGMALRTRDPTGAERELSAALERAPINRHCLLALSSCALARGAGDVAERFARSALADAPHDRDARNALGAALLARQQLVAAAETFPGADEVLRDPSSLERETLGRGVALRLLGHLHEAIEYYEAVLPGVPSAEAHGQYALALLAAGDLPAGWQPYAFRWFEPALRAQRARYPVPMWDGQSLEGRTILLRCEQGVGDVIQFIRYAPMVKDRGAMVLLEARPGLGALARAFPGVDAIFASSEPPGAFDYWIGLLDLPRVFASTLDTIPAEVPYLRADPERVEHWRARLAPHQGLKVGLVWAGDPRHPRDRERSIALDALAPLTAIAGVQCFSLQKGPAAAALAARAHGTRIIDLADTLDDYADTAAAIEALDLIVTVDTSVAHLAGSLGRPVWTLLAKPAEWRWLEEGDASPWYPTMRLFRQKEPRDWGEVIERVRAALVTIREGTDVTHLGVARPTAAGARRTPDTAAPSRRSPSVGIAHLCYTSIGYVECFPALDAPSESLEHYGEWLEPQVELLRRVAPRDAVIIEVGSGVGYHALELATVAGERGQVLAIENAPVLRRALRENVAASDRRGVFPMPASAAGVGLDALALERADLVKIADPGYGAALVEHGCDTLWRLRPMLFVAQPTDEALDAFARRVVDFGYRCWRVECSMFNRSNFNRRDDDIFAGARSLALLALPEESERVAPTDVAASIVQLAR